VSGALTTLAFGGSLGQNIFLGAASGAMSASLAWAAQGNNPLSQRSAAESQGGGSNAARLEEIQSRLAVLEGQLPSDEQLNDILGPGDGFTNEERGTVMLERLKIEHEIQLEQDAANLYKAYQNAADRGDMLDDWTMSNLRQKYSSLRVSGTTSGSTGSVDCSDNPDPIFREACEEHEGVHHNTWRNGIGQFGGTTPAFEQWWKNPVNWGNDEIAAYGASTRYFQLALGWL
jgi:hypothetical protein